MTETNSELELKTPQKLALEENIPDDLKGLTSAQTDKVEKAASIGQSTIADQQGSVLSADTTKSSPDPRFVDSEGKAQGTDISVVDAKQTPDATVTRQLNEQSGTGERNPVSTDAGWQSSEVGKVMDSSRDI